MSIIQQHTAASLSDAWRTINVDALDEDSPLNFDTSTLRPPQPEISEAEVRSLAGQVRQLLRGGDAEGALRGCLEFPVYNGPDAAKVRTPPTNTLCKDPTSKPDSWIKRLLRCHALDSDSLPRTPTSRLSPKSSNPSRRLR